MPKVVLTVESEAQLYEGAAGEHPVRIDRGNGTGGRSIDHLLVAIGSCSLGTLHEYVVRKHLPVLPITVETSAEWNEADGVYADFEVILSVSGNPSDRELSTFKTVAETCRISKTIGSGIDIDVEIVRAGD